MNPTPTQSQAAASSDNHRCIQLLQDLADLRRERDAAVGELAGLRDLAQRALPILYNAASLASVGEGNHDEASVRRLIRAINSAIPVAAPEAPKAQDAPPPPKNCWCAAWPVRDRDMPSLCRGNGHHPECREYVQLLSAPPVGEPVPAGAWRRFDADDPATFPEQPGEYLIYEPKMDGPVLTAWFWLDDSWRPMRTGCSIKDAYAPTHWQPLPAGPTEGAK